jgi:histidine kinase-like protein
MEWPPRPAPGSDGQDPAALPAELGLAVIAGLADDVQVSRNDDGLSIRMSWPSGPPAS